MSQNTTAPPPENSDGEEPVRIVGVPHTLADHPALRKIARAILSVAARRIGEDNSVTDQERSHE
jgi:hypothetical protein